MLPGSLINSDTTFDGVSMNRAFLLSYGTPWGYVVPAQPVLPVSIFQLLGGDFDVHEIRPAEKLRIPGVAVTHADVSLIFWVQC